MTETEIAPPLARHRVWRRLLMLGVPLIALTGLGLIWLSGGRSVGTDNAFVKAENAALSAEVSGTIATVYVATNEAVAEGQPLFKLDTAPFDLQLASARAALMTLRAEIEGQKAQYRQLEERLRSAKEDLAFQKRAYDRQKVLADKKYASTATLDKNRHGVVQAKGAIRAIHQDMAAIKARLGGDPNIAVEDHPAFKEASLREEKAALDLTHTQIVAPFAGIATHVPHAGEFVRAGTNVMTVVSADNLWVEANMKETDLTHVRTGQKVDVHLDVYPGYEWHGTISSISPATGAEFSILPPQNATGNWVKVVQRVPVRIALAPAPNAPPLRAGLSAEIDIDIEQSRSLGGIWRSLFANNKANGHAAIAR